MNKNIFDLIIIGAGPAGVTAGVYATRKKIKTLIITKDFGGQSVVSEFVENWTGEIKISGKDLAKKMKEQLEHYKSDDFIIKEFSLVNSILKNTNNNFEVRTKSGEIFESKTVLITSGAQRRKLTVEGADEFEHKGSTYCASCDGPLFANKDVVVIGGGNSGFESASQLLAYCKSVTLLHRGSEYRAEETVVEQVLNNKKMTGILNAKISEIFGSNFVEGIKYKDKNDEEISLDVAGVFIEIGAIPATNFIENNLVKKNEIGEIIVNHKTCESSLEGLWVAGDANDGLYKQNGVAIGDGVKAIENIYNYLQKK